WRVRMATRFGANEARMFIAATALFTVVNIAWFADWLRTLSYSQYNAGRWLEAHVPQNSVILGDVAPGITMDTRLLAVNVMKGLCNDRTPTERWSTHPAFIAMLDEPRFRGPYWVERYPDLVRPERRILYRRVIKWW